MASNQGNIENVLYQATAQAVYNNEKGDFQALKVIAKEYLERVEILSTFYENAISKSNLSEKINNMYSKMRQNEDYTRQMLRYQHDFEVGLNNFLGRNIFLAYVNEDGSINYYGNANIGKLYQQATAQKGRGNISQGKMFDANDLQQNIKDLLLKSQMSKNAVYTNAIDRYSKNQNEDSMKKNPSKGTYWWLLEDGYHKHFTNPIGNRGEIAEGYAAAVINEDNSISNNNLQGDSGSLSILYYNYIQGKKNSIGAAIKGDVKFGQDGSLQFAVKSGSFSTGMVGQYINLAINIQQINEISLENFEEALPKLIKLSKVADQIIKAANKKAIQKAKQEILNKVAVGE